MLTIKIAKQELWNETKEEFVEVSAQTLELEHSLISLSKWESKWNKPFLDKKPKTNEELVDYVRCMTINKNIPEETYYGLSADNIKAINDYINAPMTATTFHNLNQKGKQGKKETVTSELIYYKMIALGIPFECQKWHLNRLITLINVCDFKSQPGDKMPMNELASFNSTLNAQRRNMMRSRG